MAVAFVPHLITVYPLAETVDEETLAVNAPTLDTGVEVPCMIEPLKASTAMNATGVEVRGPHMLYADCEYSSAFSVNARVAFGDRRFAVKAKPQVFEMGLPTDHIEVLLEELELAS